MAYHAVTVFVSLPTYPKRLMHAANIGYSKLTWLMHIVVLSVVLHAGRESQICSAAPYCHFSVYPFGRHFWAE